MTVVYLFSGSTPFRDTNSSFGQMSYQLALIPVLNASLIIKNAVSGTVQWNYVATAFVASVVYAVVLLFFAKKWFEKESVLFRT